MNSPPIASDKPVTDSVDLDKTGSRRWFVVSLLALGAIIAFCDRNNISAANAHKPFVESFHMSGEQRGLVLSAFTWIYALLQIPMGWLVDRYGSKVPYAISLVFWSAATAATGLARNVTDLIALRALTGAGEAIMVPASFRWMRQHFSEQQSGLAVGIYMLGTKIGPAISFPFAGWLILNYDWRWMFVVTGALGIIWLIPWLLVVKNDKPKPIEKVASAPTVSTWRLFGNILASPVTWGAIITNYCYAYFLYYCMTWMPAYFVEQHGISFSNSNLLSMLNFVCIAIVALLAGWAADTLIKRGGDAVFVRKAFIVSGFIIASTELLGMRATTLNGALFWSAISLSGLGLATANNLALCRMTLMPKQATGLITGIQNVSTSFAAGFSAYITGRLLDKSGGYGAPMMVNFFVLVLGAVATIVLMRRSWVPKVIDEGAPAASASQ